MNKVLFNPIQIQDVTYGISQHLNSLYNEQNEDQVVFAPLLQGAVPFFADVAKGIMFDPYVDYIGISSYEGVTQKEFNLYRMFDPSLVKGKTVWLFDDVVDSGNTLSFLTKLLSQFGAKEIKTCVLIKKKSCTFTVDLYGFECDEWIWGYGMDAPNGRGRLKNAIYSK